MSRELPAHPNLEHLKNQAKELLRERRQHHRRATLASAQHALAREYGFKSWRALKAHVESVPGPTPTTPTPTTPTPANDRTQPATSSGLVFARYTAKAREALFYSRFEAAQMGSVEIEPPHLLLGLVRAAQGFSSRLFASLPLEQARAAVTAAFVPQPALPNSHMILFSEATKNILLRAVTEADRHGHGGIGVVHLLLGLLHDEGSLVGTALTRAGIGVEDVTKDVDRLVDETTM
jgi:hypothetical protein